MVENWWKMAAFWCTMGAMETGKAIKILRDAARLSQRDLAKAAKISAATVVNMEGATDSLPRHNTWQAVIRALSQYLSVPADHLHSFVLVTTKGFLDAETVLAMETKLSRSDSLIALSDILSGMRALHVTASDLAVRADMSLTRVMTILDLPQESMVAEVLRLTAAAKKIFEPLVRRHRENADKAMEGVYRASVGATHGWVQTILPMDRPYTTTDADASRADPATIKHNIPVRSLTAAGSAMDHQDRIFTDRYLPSALVPHPEWNLGAFEVAGDSMAPYINAGDIVIIGERLQNVRTDDICIFGFKNGEHTLKKLRVVDPDTWELIALNPLYPPLRVKVEELAWWVPVLGRWEPMWRRRQIPWEKDV
jgi:SOS-response transcriptional repressor LexA